MHYRGKTVVISGASQGLGKQMAIDLYKMGANVVVLARSTGKLEALCQELQEQNSESQWAKHYSIDLSSKDSYKAFNDWLVEEQIVPDMVVCCAGSSTPKLFTDLTLDELDSGININYKTCVYLIHTLVPFMSEKGGDVVIVSSAVAFYSFIGYSQYSPMKSALKSLGDTLRHELTPMGIQVHTVFPGNFDSEGYQEENLTKPSITAEIEGSSYPITVEECSQIVIRGINRNKKYIFTDFISWVLFTFSLGFSPRDYYGLEILTGLIGLIFGRLVDIFHEYLIKRWYAAQKKSALPQPSTKDD